MICAGSTYRFAMTDDLYDPSELSPPPWRTERLVLRRYKPEDAEAAHAALDLDEEDW